MRLVLDCCNTDINAIMYEDHRFSYEIRKVRGLGTAFHEAARAGQLSTVETLIKNGADTTISDSRGDKAIAIAERVCNHAIVEELRSNESEQDSRARKGVI